MSIINYTDQIKYSGGGYLDAKMMPVATVDDLKKIDRTERFEGLTVTVLNNGNPKEYWLIGGTSNSNWVPKDDFDSLRLVLENGFLKLTDNGKVLGDPIDLNEYFNGGGDTPSEGTDKYIAEIKYVQSDNKGNQGIFIEFAYNDGTKKYLDMSQFVAATYEQGEGIVIDGKVISIDAAITDRISALESSTKTLSDKVVALESDVEINKGNIANAIASIATKAEKSDVQELDKRLSETIEAVKKDVATNATTLSAAVNDLEERIGTETAARVEADVKHTADIVSLSDAIKAIAGIEKLIPGQNVTITDNADGTREISVNIELPNTEAIEADINSLKETVETHATQIAQNAKDIDVLEERLNSISGEVEGSTPDGKTIGLDENNALTVKISANEENVLQKTDDGLFVQGLVMFLNDEEINNEK